MGKIMRIDDLSKEQRKGLFSKTPVKPRIIDADEVMGECDMSYDFKLAGWQARNPGKLGRWNSGACEYKAEKSPGDLERRAKQYLKDALDKIQ